MKIYLLTLFTAAVFIAGCGDSQIDIIEKQIHSKVKEDAPHLAQLEAVYGIVFTNKQKNLIFHDDIYLRRDRASVYYGYNLDKAVIKVTEEGDKRILNVTLPVPKQISIDRKVVEVNSTHKGYHPEDEDGNLINVDEQIHKHLQKVVRSYEDKTIEMTRNLSKQYFEALADRFGCELNLVFEQRRSPESNQTIEIEQDDGSEE